MNTVLRTANRRPYIVRNKSGTGLDAWKAAKAALDAGGSGISNVVVLGDSAGEGQWAATTTDEILAKGYVGLMNAAFAARWAVTGVGFQTAISLSMGNTDWTYSPWDYDEHWTFSYGSYGPGACSMRAEYSGAVASIQFHGTGIVINCTCGWTTGTANIAIDSVSKTAMNTAFSGLTSQSFTYDGLEDGDHALTITTASASPIILNGVYPLNAATRGIRVIRNCVAGIGMQPFSIAAPLYASVTQWDPVLTIIALIANDAGAASPPTPANYKTYAQTIITQALTHGSVLLYANYPRPDKDADISDPYLAKLQELSDENDVPLIDMITPYKGLLASMGVVASDNIHPNARGHRLLKQPLLDVLI